MSSLQIGRLVLSGPPASPTEPLGDPIASQGGAVVPGQRTALQWQLALATSVGAFTSVAAGQRLRRQLRSLLNNTDLKLQAFLYIVYSDDAEMNGWYAPDTGTMAATDRASWLGAGLAQTAEGAWLLIGHPDTHREARQAWVKDLRTGMYDRDTLGLIRSTDFSALPALSLTTLPNGAVQPMLASSAQTVAISSLPAGRDGGQCLLVQGLSDLQVISYERPESALNLSDVIVYDRRGAGDAPTSGPGATWQEVYGPDWRWNWRTAGQTADCPVLSNGLVRVRWDATNTPGFRVDVWNGTAFSEQGKMCFYRHNAPSGYDDTWIAAGLHTDSGYTPERAVMSVALANSADSSSRERVFVTMQRGEMGVTFECYPALEASGNQSDITLEWTPALNSGAADQNTSVFKSDTQMLPAPLGTGVLVATAGTGAGAGNSGVLPGGTLGASSFSSSENYVSILRCPTTYNAAGPYQTVLTVIQAGGVFTGYSSGSNAYGTTQNRFAIWSQGNAGYVQAGISFTAAARDQVNEAEAIRNGSATTSAVTDSTASASTSVKDTQTAATNLTLYQGTSSLIQGKYRVFARAKVDSGATGSFRARLGSTDGSTATSTSTSWTWLDLGDVLAPFGSPSLGLTAWRSAGASGSVYVDRLELHLVESRTATGALYNGARDAGQAALMDARMLGAIQPR